MAAAQAMCGSSHQEHTWISMGNLVPGNPQYIYKVKPKSNSATYLKGGYRGWAN